jgi:hypothetical protein
MLRPQHCGQLQVEDKGMLCLCCTLTHPYSAVERCCHHCSRTTWRRDAACPRTHPHRHVFDHGLVAMTPTWSQMRPCQHHVLFPGRHITDTLEHGDPYEQLRSTHEAQICSNGSSFCDGTASQQPPVAPAEFLPAKWQHITGRKSMLHCTIHGMLWQLM